MGRYEYIQNRHLIIQYPLSLFEKGINDDVINELIWYGLFKSAQKATYTPKDVLQHALKKYNKHFDSYELNKFLHQLGANIITEIQSKSLNYQIKEFQNIFEMCPDLFKYVIELYQVSVVLKFFSIFGHSETIIKKGREIQAQLRGDEPTIGININDIFTYKNKLPRRN